MYRLFIAVSRVFSLFITAIILTVPMLSGNTVQASDHMDTPLLTSIQRNDAKLTDLYAFVRDENLVLVLGTNPAIPADVSDYQFPMDVTYRFFIDNDSKVRFNNDDDSTEFGGTIVRPSRIRENLAVEIRFDEFNEPQLQMKKIFHHREKTIVMENTKIFAGLTDDPFIVKPRIGRNVAAIVVEFPLKLALSGRRHWHRVLRNRRNHRSDTLLIWATSSVDTVNGNQIELVGRAFRSTFPENDLMNTLHPRLHHSQLGVAPDVMIFDVSKTAQFPNGRTLTDDVATIIADPRIVAIDDPSPIENNVPFVDEFPYLADPQ